MATVIILEVTKPLFDSLEGKIRRMCKTEGVEAHVHHARSKDVFEVKLQHERNQGNRAVLMLCDIADQQGTQANELRSYIESLWIAEEPNTWQQQWPIILYSRDDKTYKKMKQRAQHTHRKVPSKVISQNPVAGSDPEGEVKTALLEAIRACHA